MIKKVKEKILSLVNSRKVNTDIKMVCEDAAEYEGKTKIKEKLTKGMELLDKLKSKFSKVHF
jgi:predicted DNA-binding protein YlxM (UPF0122 family)